MFVLPKLGIQPDKELNIVQVGSVPSRFAALVNGSVMGALLIPPETVKAKELGYRVLSNFADIDIAYQQNGVYTTRSLINRRAEMVRRFATAYSEGNHYIHTIPKVRSRSCARRRPRFPTRVNPASKRF
jgi:ABC-type nitrate/sulfonate/bicarbonate transport system substrate-binding protein